ncbi:hypothetical protein CLF_105377 [Clonorchis sinensis]|uniref:Uncharacterized protein n=1 Tax=Clonorchis sinensis TaxID=79923 RepID=G7YP80_CLOSI|nr:hypothetical protein CLF_105377 [Clonorchis sinensis]
MAFGAPLYGFFIKISELKAYNRTGNEMKWKFEQLIIILINNTDLADIPVVAELCNCSTLPVSISLEPWDGDRRSIFTSTNVSIDDLNTNYRNCFGISHDSFVTSLTSFSTFRASLLVFSQRCVLGASSIKNTNLRFTGTTWMPLRRYGNLLNTSLLDLRPFKFHNFDDFRSLNYLKQRFSRDYSERHQSLTTTQRTLQFVPVRLQLFSYRILKRILGQYVRSFIFVPAGLGPQATTNSITEIQQSYKIRLPDTIPVLVLSRYLDTGSVVQAVVKTVISGRSCRDRRSSDYDKNYPSIEQSGISFGSPTPQLKLQVSIYRIMRTVWKFVNQTYRMNPNKTKKADNELPRLFAIIHANQKVPRSPGVNSTKIMPVKCCQLIETPRQVCFVNNESDLAHTSHYFGFAYPGKDANYRKYTLIKRYRDLRVSTVPRLCLSNAVNLLKCPGRNRYTKVFSKAHVLVALAIDGYHPNFNEFLPSDFKELFQVHQEFKDTIEMGSMDRVL